MDSNKKTIKEVAYLLIDAGAEVKNDILSTDIVLPPKAPFLQENGLRFSKRLFNPSLKYDSDGRLYYALQHTPPVFLRVEVLLNGDSGHYKSVYDLEKDAGPSDFWDRLYVMIHRLKDILFISEPPDLAFTWSMLYKTEKKHASRPCRETYLLRRTLQNFMDEEIERSRQLRRRENRKLQETYEKLLAVANTVPHSLNVLRHSGLPIKITGSPSHSWRVDVYAEGEEYSSFGANPVFAAGVLLRTWGKEIKELKEEKLRRVS